MVPSQEQLIVINMLKLIVWISVALLIIVVALAVLTFLDQHADDKEWRRLVAFQPLDPATYSETMVEGLPEPARRYFNYTIQPDTPLLIVAEVNMVGCFGLGAKDSPAYQPMQARQILALPEGFVWTMRTGGGMPVSGSDSRAWTRFRLLGLIPVARQGGGMDHARSSFGRYVAEAVFWTPAALLPAPHVSWKTVDNDTARVTVQKGKLVQSVDVTVDSEGRPVVIALQRWSNANPDKAYRLQPFGGNLSDFRDVDGFRLPHKVEAGNMFGTKDYFPFFSVEVTSIRFPDPK